MYVSCCTAANLVLPSYVSSWDLPITPHLTNFTMWAVIVNGHILLTAADPTILTAWPIETSLYIFIFCLLHPTLAVVSSRYPVPTPLSVSIHLWLTTPDPRPRCEGCLDYKLRWSPLRRCRPHCPTRSHLSLPEIIIREGHASPVAQHRVESRFAPSRWEPALLYNDVSHWLGARLESALLACDFGIYLAPVARSPLLIKRSNTSVWHLRVPVTVCVTWQGRVDTRQSSFIVVKDLWPKLQEWWSHPRGELTGTSSMVMTLYQASMHRWQNA